jgi:hypothetical protein
MKNKGIKFWSVILFYGSLWGIVEASVGYVLHFLPALIAGTILFPFASIMLYKTYKDTQSKSAMLAVGIVAAAIKALNFLMPIANPFKVINPMVSIVLEALVVMAFVTLVANAKWPVKISAILVSSILWRSLYLVYMAGQMLFTGYVATQIASVTAMMDFVLISGLLSGVMASVFIAPFVLNIRNNRFKLATSPLVSLGMFVLGIVLTFVL